MALGALGEIAGRSGLYRTTPVGGPAGQADYLNAVIALRPRPENDPERLLAALLAIEERMGRRRRTRWEARVLDLDLLAYGDRVGASATLVLPHPRLLERPFVLAPLCEVLPGWRHPVTGVGPCEVLAGLDASGVARTDLGWEPS